MLGQGVDRVRGEHVEHAADVEGKSRAASRRAKQRLSESQARHSQHEKRADAIELRVDAIVQALAAERCARAEAIAGVEEVVRGSRAGRSPRNSFQHHHHPAPDNVAVYSSWGTVSTDVPPASHMTQLVSSHSLQRLEALEARFDRGAGAKIDAASTSTRTSPRFPNHGGGSGDFVVDGPKPTATEGTIGRLRQQLEGLRSELVEESSCRVEEPSLVGSPPGGVAKASLEDAVEPRNLGEPLRYITVSPKQTRCNSAPVTCVPRLPMHANETNTLGSPRRQVEVLRPTMHNYVVGAAAGGQRIVTDTTASPMAQLHEPRLLAGITQQEPIAIPVEQSQGEFTGNFPTVAVVARPQQGGMALGSSFSQQQAATASWMPTAPAAESFQHGYSMMGTVASQVGAMEPSLCQQGISASREQYCGAGLTMAAVGMATEPDLAHHARPVALCGGSADVACTSFAASEPVKQDVGLDLSTSQSATFPPLDLGQCSRSVPCPPNDSATPPISSGRRTLTTGPAKILRVAESSPNGMVEARPSDLADTRHGPTELQSSSEAGCAGMLFPRRETDRAMRDSLDGIQGSSRGDANHDAALSP